MVVSKKIKFLSLILFILQWNIKATCLAGVDNSLVKSQWLISFENIPRPLQVFIEKDLNHLPARYIAIWEKDLYKESTQESLETLKRQTDYQIALDQLNFSLHNYQRQQVYNLSYPLSSLECKTLSKQKEPIWAKLVFNNVDKDKVKTLNSKTGWLELSSPTSKGEELLVIRLTIHLRNGTKEEKEFAFIASEDNRKISNTIRDALANHLLNYNWMRLSFPVEPVDALFQIGPFTFSGNDPKLLFFPLDELPVRICVVKEAYKKKCFLIQKAQDVPEKVILENLAQEHFIFNSHPSPANLYIDNLWLGQTPLNFQTVPQGKFISVEAKDFKPRYFPLDTLKSETFVDLGSQNRWKDLLQLKKNRKRFYSSLGTFILSFVPTALFASMDINSTKLQEMGYKCNLVLTSSLFWGSISFNIGCLIWNIVESVLYIKQAEKCAQP